MKLLEMMSVMILVLLITGCGVMDSFLSSEVDPPSGNFEPGSPRIRVFEEKQVPHIDPYSDGSFASGIPLVWANAYDNCKEIQNYIHGQLTIKRDKYKEIAKEYQEYQEQLRKYRDWQEEKYGPRPKVLMAGTSEKTQSDSSESYTNIQEEGVDEADFVKIGEKLIYVATQSGIQVIDRQEKKVLGILDTKNLNNLNLFTIQDRLVVLGNEQNHPNEYQVKIYQKLDEEDLPSLISEKKYQGSLIDTRFVNGKLILVMRDQLAVNDPYTRDVIYSEKEIEEKIPGKPVKQKENKINNIPCEQIARPIVEDMDFRLTKVITIDVQNNESEDYIAAKLGGGDNIYMTLKSLYVTKGDYNWFQEFSFLEKDKASQRNSGRRRFIRSSNSSELHINKFAFNLVSYHSMMVAYGKVRGYVKDQWAFKGFDNLNALSVVTTTGVLWAEGDAAAKNHLWILQQQGQLLKRVDSINDFGLNEDVRSVRYVKNMAYVVTFKKTDPLFAFDLSNPLKPELLGELKIPGFSLYMHPVSEGRMVGVGFDAKDMGEYALYQGIQVSLFDIENPENMARIDNKIYGIRGSYSEVNSNHHAFFYDEQSGLMGIPLVELGSVKYGQEDWEYENKLNFSGAVIYQVERDEMIEVARLSHKDIIPTICKNSEYGRWWQADGESVDINRVYKVDEQLLTVSKFGIKFHSLDDPSEVEEVINFDNECENRYNYYY